MATPNGVNVKPNTAKQQQTATATCEKPPACFIAGTLVQTTEGLKPIEQIQRGDLVWSRQEFGNAYAYKPVFETKRTENQQLYEVVVENRQGETETYFTTSEHPFYIDGLSWLKASLLETGMPLLDRDGNSGSLKVHSQTKLERWETVYNLEVEDYVTYHIGKLGVWVHNVCCRLPPPQTAAERRNSPGTAFSSTTLTELKMGNSLFGGRNATKVPKQVADKLSGRQFNNFDQFRQALWKEMAEDPAVARNFSSANLNRMKKGLAPFAISSQHNGKNMKYELDHHIEIRDGGAVYNLDNIVIRTPKNHVEKSRNR